MGKFSTMKNSLAERGIELRTFQSIDLLLSQETTPLIKLYNKKNVEIQNRYTKGKEKKSIFVIQWLRI